MNRYQTVVLSLLFVMLLCPVAAAQPVADADFSGAWDTTYGFLEIQQEGQTVAGTYTYGGGSTIAGTVAGARLTFRYTEPTATGEGWFDIGPSGDSFSGSWHEDGSADWYPWTGTRTGNRPGTVETSGFDGLFDSTYGRLRLSTNGDGITGSYTYGGGSTIEGTIEGNRLSFRYQEPTVAGHGWFELSDDESAFSGQWQGDGTSTWSEWTGQRVVPESGTTWLVVLEAPWETSLAENEYAFGDMLRAYFERMPHVQVRHRRFYDKVDFMRAAGELAYLAEPVALVVASHGSSGMLTVNADTISPSDVGAALSLAPNVFAIHFSSCEIMVADAATQIHGALPEGRYLAVSGYATSVDWSASALIEFLYLDLILGRGMSPSRAAEAVRQELLFAGDTQDSVIGPARFRFED